MVVNISNVGSIWYYKMNILLLFSYILKNIRHMLDPFHHILEPCFFSSLDTTYKRTAIANEWL
jgi:hypothetical protein